ncbi:hypothetical protein MGN70_005916 [Eutypa lata]|uniref:Uncharacterized protein n=1 Tax=Eutypa lata (strain UCR-EL1) TaxID=1287681 RepID=M7SDD8_EUTLA|nr:hypothetical protein UCREL1_10886 [Eutypa lata UCREL1]KAI1251348.1 hypothetical protein MGN70_005916 [Eutypa lata]
MDDIKASYDRNNLNRVEYPLHEIGQMEDPIEIRLAWAEEAIAAGNDPNELDIYGGLSRGLDRPLHCAVNGGGPPENLQLVRFLLDRGADPRLRDARNRLTPMWLAELWSKGDEKLPSNYYPEALKMMKAAAKKLDERGEIPGGLLGRAKWYLGLGPQLPEKKAPDMRKRPEADCVFCRKGRLHEWHLYCYVGTIKECREVPRDHIKGELLQPLEPTGYIPDFPYR